MQITIGQSEATAIVMALIACTGFVVRFQWKVRESLLTLTMDLKALSSLSRGLADLSARVHELELYRASQDPHRRRRMHPLSRAAEEQPGGEEE